MDGVTAPASRPGSRARTIGMWIFRIVIGLMFLLAAGLKLTGYPMMVAEFATVGLGQWFRYFTGLLELVGAVLVLWPRTTGLGAVILLVVDVGAFVAQVSLLHVDWIHTVIIGLALASLAWLQRSTIRLPVSST